MSGRVIGWDVGGAHLKAALVVTPGRVERVHQEPCRLWLGLVELEQALDRLLAVLPDTPDTRHAVTMTGELADCFASREEGVLALTRTVARRLGADRVRVFRGDGDLVPATAVTAEHAPRIASANWLALGAWAARRLDQGLLIDIGSTTTDLLVLRDGRPRHRGYTDSERMGYDELLYSGIVRTPLMALAPAVPLDGAWAPVMAELFATTADVYRLSGELDETLDQAPAADQGPKTVAGSRRRLARQFGRDAAMLPEARWEELAMHLRERHLTLLRRAVDLQFSRGLLDASAPLVGAGGGRFLVEVLAARLGRDYVDGDTLFAPAAASAGFSPADCGPAAALACLAAEADQFPS